MVAPLEDIRIVDLKYTHGFNSGDDEGAPEAVRWRTNPKTSGPTFVLGDIGTHIYYMSEIILPNMKIKKLLYDDGFTIAGARSQLREEIKPERNQAALPFPTNAQVNVAHLRNELQQILHILSARH